MKDLNERVINVVKSAINASDEVDENSQLRELGFDSLKNVELVILLEEEFDLNFDDSKLSQSRFENVQSVIDFVRESLG